MDGSETRMDLDIAPISKPPQNQAGPGDQQGAFANPSNTVNENGQPIPASSTPGPLATTANAANGMEHSNVPPSLTSRATGYVYDVLMMLHSPTPNSDSHPERPERIMRIFEALKTSGCESRMVKLELRSAKREEVLLVHSEDLWDKVQAIQYMDEEEIIAGAAFYEGLSLYVHPSTPRAAEMSCGGVIEAALAVARGKVKNAFAIVRPPGHHAEPDEHMGFCFFNNCAVAARVVQEETPLKRILILDWDVHHGNGTQRAFYDDPSVLYISIHRYDQGEFYPTGPYGSMESVGEGVGVGRSVNIPWPTAGMGDADYLYAFQRIVMPIAYEFAPEFVIISAGFDAARGDELGECDVTPEGYAHMTYMLSALAGGKVLVALEGGYNLESISASAIAVTKVLLGDAPPEIAPMIASEWATETVWQVAMVQTKYWKSIDPKACEPRQDIEDVTHSLPDVLKAHRSQYLAQKFWLVDVPFADKELAQKFGGQMMCTQDIYTQKTLIVYAHDFGNLRVELQGTMYCDVDMEKSYLFDATRVVVEWIQKEKFGLLDLNMLAKTRPHKAVKSAHRIEVDKGATEAIKYIWDNYVDLGAAESVILIGQGFATQALIELINSRAVMKKVKGVVQILGHGNIPGVAKGEDDLVRWYRQHSLVIIPANHHQVQQQKMSKRHGAVEASSESRASHVLMSSLPKVKEFTAAMLRNEPWPPPERS